MSDPTIVGDPRRLDAHLQLLQPVGLRVEHARLRVLDAVHWSGRTYGRIDVSVSPSVEAQDRPAATGA